MSKLTEFIQLRTKLNHKNNMPARVRTIGQEVAQGLHPYMNNCQIADTMGVHERSVRRWLNM